MKQKADHAKKKKNKRVHYHEKTRENRRRRSSMLASRYTSSSFNASFKTCETYRLKYLRQRGTPRRRNSKDHIRERARVEHMRDEFLSFEIDLSKKKHERENNIFLLFSLLSVVLSRHRSRIIRSGALGFCGGGGFTKARSAALLSRWSSRFCWRERRRERSAKNWI